MTQLMTAKSISAGSLTVMRNGVIVLQHVYGWQDKARQVPLRPDAIFRIASCTKPFTAAAIRKLIANGKLSLSSRVFSMGKPGAGVLDYAPFGTPDIRLGNITVDHLLKHRGGWDRSLVGDLTYMDKTIATAMGVSSPPGRDNTVRYIMGQPLQHPPGKTYAYSNIGYLLLGLIVEKVSGQDYRSYVQSNVIGLDGSTTKDWVLARSFAADMDPREPFYDHQTTAINVFYPAQSSVPTVEAPYGSFDMEARTGQGRIVTNGLVLVRYLNRFQVNGDLIGGPRPAPGSWRWNHTGSQKGANALARERGDGINYAVMFNKDPLTGADYASTIRTQIDAILDAGGITWPTADVTKQSAPVPQVSISASPVKITCTTQPGRYYQCQSSEDRVTWTPCLTPFVGTGSTVVQKPAESSKKLSYRVVVSQ